MKMSVSALLLCILLAELHVTAAIPATASIIIVPASNGSCVVSAIDGTSGVICAASCDAAEVINAGVGRCLGDGPATGAVVQLRRGVYNLSTSISISRSGVTLQGEGGGDLYFTADGTYHGISNKSGTLLVAAGPFDAVDSGAPVSTFCISN